jgi:hypothetical protein
MFKNNKTKSALIIMFLQNFQDYLEKNISKFLARKCEENSR